MPAPWVRILVPDVAMRVSVITGNRAELASTQRVDLTVIGRRREYSPVNNPSESTERVPRLPAQFTRCQLPVSGTVMISNKWP
jgi:hypothetical protein